MTRTLLMVTLYFPPCSAVAALRMTGLARHLPRFGWNTVVVAPPNPPHEPTDPALTDLVPAESTTLVSVPYPEGLWGKINRKFFPDRLWIRRALDAAKSAIRAHRPDVLYTSHPPGFIHEIGLTLKREFGLPWVACFRDPWHALAPKPDPADRAAEAAVVDLADVVVGVSPGHSDGLARAYPAQARKIVTITNGYDPENFDAGLAPPPRDRLSVLYTGELYHGRDPRGLLDAIASWNAEPPPGLPPLRFDFVGRYVPEQCDLPREIASRGLDGAASISPVIPYKECLRTSMRADILVLLHFPGFAHGLPAKIFEYLGARRPILALTDHPGDIAWVLKESGALHRIAPQNDVGKIRQALEDIVGSLRAGIPAAPPPRERTPFTREDMARKLAEQLDRLVAPTTAERIFDRAGAV